MSILHVILSLTSEVHCTPIPCASSKVKNVSSQRYCVESEVSAELQRDF
uniref:Uncharacterized protein n=1 Tax=Anguilla anguilla TaxID=7936 RepID=A0A0E9TCA9_ANGAN